MKLSVVILNWNRKEDTKLCIKSLLSSDLRGIDLEILVVDNGSTDGSEEELKKIKTNGVSYEVILTGTNLGFAGGNNVGIKHAINHGSDYVLILNNDTLVDKRMLISFAKEAEKHPKAAILSPKIYFAPGFEYHKNKYKRSELGRVIWYAGGNLDWNNIYGENRGVDEVDHGQYDEQIPIDFATGAAMFCRISAIKKVGDFDEKYFMYLEDADLSVRMKKADFGVLYCPRAFLWHKVAQSSTIGGELNDYFIGRNRMLFGMKYAKLKTKLALVRESLKILKDGRKWQKIAIRDFYLMNFGRGSWGK